MSVLCNVDVNNSFSFKNLNNYSLKLSQFSFLHGVNLLRLKGLQLYYKVLIKELKSF